MSSSHSSKRLRRDTRLSPEILESRELLTGGAGTTFAIIEGTIAKSGQVDVLKFTVDDTHFHLPKGKFTLGVDVAKDPSTGLTPLVSSITSSSGQRLPLTHSVYPKNLPNTTITPGSKTTAVTVPIKLDTTKANDSTTFTVAVKGLKGTTGNFLLGFYLPGDTTGTGTVASTDVAAIKKLVGTSATSANYNFADDSNRDGKITSADVMLAKQNVGVTTNVSPTVSANLDPASVTTLSGNVTTLATVHYTGVATPGAAVKFADTTGKTQPVATTADSLGNYSIEIPMAPGTSTFQVTTMDAFGQTISGTISPVTYQTQPAVTPATQQTGTTT